MNFYTGIGSRQTPPDVLETMARIAAYLSAIGYTVRSGGAGGADEAFETAVTLADGPAEIYLPHENFRGKTGTLPGASSASYYVLDSMDRRLVHKAMDIASRFHPAWDRLSAPAVRFHTRNTFQVLGMDLETPSKFVVCWTGPTGGTTQALRIAKAYGIPVFNLIEPGAVDELKSFLRKTAV